MNSKKIISGLLALSFVFGGAVLPNAAVSTGAVISASAEDAEVLTYGDYDYTILEDGTVEIAKYNGTDEVVEIPSEIDGKAVTSIGAHVFDEYDSEEFVKVTSIVIPDSVTVIKEFAFENCSRLENITLPKNLKYIGDCAFLGNGIKSIVIPDSVEYIKGGAFYSCMKLESITLPKNLKNIEDSTFEDCNSLTGIVIPDSVEVIGRSAFKSCHVLSDVTLPKNLINIGDSAFEYCNCLGDIVIPDGVDYIGWHAFANVDSYFNSGSKNYYNYSVTIPKSVTSIGDNAFSDFSMASNAYKPSRRYTIKCYKDTAAHSYALYSGNNFEVIDADGSKTKYPEVIKEEYSSNFHKFRLTWTAVEGAEQYGIAVKLAGKWKVQAYVDADTTKYVTPKITAGQSYQTVICAKVNGKWDTSNIDGFDGRKFPLVVR